MKANFQYVLDNYIDNGRKVDSSTKVYSCLIKQIPKEIREYLNRDDFLIKGAMGQGNKSEYPWIGIFNRNITNTAQKGLYIVYLFKKDMSGFYVTLNQGITNFEKLYGSRKYDYAVRVSNYFKEEIDGTSYTTNEIKLGDGKTRDLGYGYERTTILSKYYPSNNFTDEVLKADLIELVSIYDLMAKHMETSSYDAIIKNVLSVETDSIIMGDEAVQAIKEAVDPDDDIPFGFNRVLKEQKPYIDKSNKFRRITNPRISKIDDLKKAAKDAKCGLIGEELVINYEMNKLINAGRDDLAQKIKWASTESDAFGYDIDSFEIDENGVVKEIKIEVKTTSSRVDTDFFITKNEVETSKKYKNNYCIYRLYDCNSQEPKFYRAFGEVEKNFILDPITFMARYKFPEVI